MFEEATSTETETAEERIQYQQLKNFEPALPHDVIGLSLDEVRNLIMQKNNEVIGLDDPLLMMVTINNAFLTEYEKLLEKHNKAISAIMSAKTEGYIKTVKGSVEKLTEELSSTSVAAIGETIQKIFHEQTLTLNNFTHNIKWIAAIIALSALVNVAVFVVRSV